MKKMIQALLFGLNVSSAAIWDGEILGKIKQIDVNSGENFGLSVYLKNTPKMCGSEHTSAYLNESESNYNTYLQVLLMA